MIPGQPCLRHLRVGVVALLTIASLTVIGAAPASAAPAGEQPGRGGASLQVTSAADSGPGTLRAIIAGAPAGPQRITFADDVHQIELTSPLRIDGQELTIDGPGVDKLRLSGRDANRIFAIGAKATVTIRGLVLERGRDVGPELGDLVPGGPGEGGAIYNAGQTTLERDVLRDDRAIGGGSPQRAGGPGRGGAIYNADTGRLRLDAVYLTNDQARGGDRHRELIGDTGKAGGPAEGGAIYNQGELRIANSEFRDDAAAGADGETVFLVFSSTGSKGGDGLGGAIFNGAQGDTVRIDKSSFGGDRALGGSSGEGAFAMRAGDAAGGAIYTDAKLGPGQSFYMSASTLVNDSAVLGPHQGHPLGEVTKVEPATLGAGALEIHSFSDATLSSDTIAFDAGAGDLRTAKPANALNTIFGSCGGAGVRSSGENLDYGTSCGLNGPDDLSSTDAQLTGLGDNGGPTRSDPPAATSPAVDMGQTTETTDQRGLPRPIRATDKDPVPGNYADIGAVEIARPAPPPKLEFDLRPEVADFGAIQVGSVSKYLEITLDNSGERDFAVASAKLTGADVDEFSISSETCAKATLRPGDGCRVRIRFSPEDEGPQAASLTIDAAAPGSPLVVPLRGTGK